MANPPIKEYSLGRIKVAKWQGEYKGTPTFSFTITKNYKDKKSGEWKQSNYFTLPDLRDVAMLAIRIIMSGIKEFNKSGGQQQKQVSPEPGIPESDEPEDLPF